MALRSYGEIHELSVAAPPTTYEDILAMNVFGSPYVLEDDSPYSRCLSTRVQYSDRCSRHHELTMARKRSAKNILFSKKWVLRTAVGAVRSSVGNAGGGTKFSTGVCASVREYAVRPCAAC